MSEHIVDERGDVNGEIIRCADCAYRDPERELNGNGWCRTNAQHTRDEDFCSWAKPKEYNE